MKNITPHMKFITSILLFIILFTSIPTQAQIGFEDDVDDQTSSTSDVPIDGFVGIGIIAGICYGIRKLKKA